MGIIYPEQKTDSNVLRIHIQHVMRGSHARLERKPRLQDGTVTVDTNEYRLVGIAPSGRDKDLLSTSNATATTEECDCM